MKVLELIERLATLDGEAKVRLRVEYFCGDYGDYNCQAVADLANIVDENRLIILDGWS